VNVAFDHVVIVVSDLGRATRDFTDAGFIVAAGGVHDVIPTRNALILFEDGGYLELLAPRDDEARESLRVRSARKGWPAELRRASAIARRFLPQLVGREGVADFIFRVENLRRAAAEMRRRGVVASGPVAMSRERADHVRLEWELLLPAEARLPFFIEDRTPRELRVPNDPAIRSHPNGAAGVMEMTVKVREVAPGALAYADLFDARPHADAEGSAHLELGGIRVVLEAGEVEGARALKLAGVDRLTPAIESLGVRGESSPRA